MVTPIQFPQSRSSGASLQVRRLEAELRESERRYRLLFAAVDRVREVIFRVGRGGEWTFLNPAWSELTGFTIEESIGRRSEEFVHVDERIRHVAELAALVDGSRTFARHEARFLTPDGDVRWMEVQARPIVGDDGSVIGAAGTLNDLTDRKHVEQQLAHQAFHDALTGLPNRALFMDRLAAALARSRRSYTGVAVLFLDLDGFKLVNDGLGHDTGDQLLCAVGQRLTSCLRPEDTVARFGGDEFTILLELPGGEAAAIPVAARIIDAFRAPFLLDGRETFVSASIGIACRTADQANPGALLRDADAALYRAKEAGRASFMVFDPHMNVQARERLQLESDLRHAIERDQLRLFYQPEVDLDTGEMIGLEALLRWEHHRDGLIMPSGFLSLAEETGLIVEIGRWVLAEACRQARRVQDRWPRPVPLVMSVNLSAREFQEPDLLADVNRIVNAAGLDPSSLRLELTEHALIDERRAVKTIYGLRELGVRLAIDDFGTGYSSLSYLRNLPVETLKIDRAFVRGLWSDDGSRAIVRAVTTLATALNMVVTAEGVETSAQVAALRAVSCHFGQGYYFSPPLPGDALDELLSYSRDFQLFSAAG